MNFAKVFVNKYQLYSATHRRSPHELWNIKEVMNYVCMYVYIGACLTATNKGLLNDLGREPLRYSKGRDGN